MSTAESTHRLERPEMTQRSIDRGQRMAAKLAGFLYLLTTVTACFAELYVRGRLIAWSDVAQTAKNIAASERLWRVGIVSDLLMYVAVVTLAWALYVVLAPINRNMALLAAFLRLAENVILAVITLNLFTAMLFAGDIGYLQAFDTNQQQALARLSLSAWAAGWKIGIGFCGLGSAVFSYVWWQSRYIPRALAAWGIFSSLVLALVTLAMLVFPGLAALGLSYMAPMGVYEVGLGLWLLVKGIRAPVVE